MKLQFTFLLFLLTVISCSLEKEEAKNDIILNCRIIELNEKRNNMNSLIVIYKAASYEKGFIDSLSQIQENIQGELDSIFYAQNTTLESVTNECQEYFGLNLVDLSANQRVFLQMVYGYKICGPKVQACGFSLDSTMEQLNKRRDLMSRARNNLNNYIEEKLNQNIKKTFPSIKKQHKKAFYIVAENISSSENFTESFRDSACLISRNDTIYNRLWADRDYSSFQEIK